MFRKALLAFFVALAMAAPASAVTWGQPDTTNEYPFVGTLLFLRQDGFFYSCTGTLLTSTVMVTAGHCVEEANQPNVATWMNFAPAISLANRSNYKSLIAFLDAEWIRTKAVVAHPQYDDFSAFPNTYDVGVVVLAKAQSMPEYGQLPALGLLDSLATGNNRKERQFTVVGYGSQGILKPIASDEWARYVGDVLLIELNSTWDGDQQSAKFTNNPGTGGGSCFGDSGGPLFHRDSNVIGAIVSWGLTPCIGVDYQFRLDTPTAQDFIKRFL